MLALHYAFVFVGYYFYAFVALLDVFTRLFTSNTPWYFLDFYFAINVGNLLHWCSHL